MRYDPTAQPPTARASTASVAPPVWQQQTLVRADRPLQSMLACRILGQPKRRFTLKSGSAGHCSAEPHLALKVTLPNKGVVLLKLDYMNKGRELMNVYSLAMQFLCQENLISAVHQTCPCPDHPTPP